MNDIARLERGPVPVPGETQADLLFQSLLWSDPKPTGGKSSRGLGWHFSATNTRRFLQLNNLKYIIRSHECIEGGYSETHDGLVKTVFSASNYELNNNANIALINSNLEVNPAEKGGWNEIYMKQEWTANMAEPVFDPTDVLEGKGFTDFSVTVDRSVGGRLGLNVSVDHPVLEFLIVSHIKEGIVQEYNSKNPTQRLQIGDAITKANFVAGYAPIEEVIRTATIVKFDVRRPLVRRLKLDKKKDNLPPLEMIQFPEVGFAFSLEGWGDWLTSTDRIYEVNGSSAGKVMQMRMVEDSVLDLVVFRYVPEDVEVMSLEEKRAKNLRATCTTAWQDDEDERKLAIQVVNRTRRDEAVAGSVGINVLQQLYNLIFLNRPQLLENFQEADREDSLTRIGKYKGKVIGKVTPTRWAEVLKRTLKTPEEFPWLSLLPFLSNQTTDGEVAYASFLMHYTSLLYSWLLEDWCDMAFGEIMHFLENSPLEKFAELDDQATGKLNFVQLREWFTSLLYSQEPASRSEKRLRELQLYALFSKMESSERDGWVARREFVSRLNHYKKVSTHKCPKGHQLQHGALPCWQNTWQIYTCNDCGKSLEKRHRRFCETCGFDLCIRCYQARLETDEQVLKEVRAKGDGIESDFISVERVLRILCMSQVNLSDLLRDHSTASYKIVEKDDFIRVVEKLSGSNEAATTFHRVLCHFLKVKHGWVTDYDHINLTDCAQCVRVCFHPHEQPAGDEQSGTAQRLVGGYAPQGLELPSSSTQPRLGGSLLGADSHITTPLSKAGGSLTGAFR